MPPAASKTGAKLSTMDMAALAAFNFIFVSSVGSISCCSRFKRRRIPGTFESGLNVFFNAESLKVGLAALCQASAHRSDVDVGARRLTWDGLPEGEEWDAIGSQEFTQPLALGLIRSHRNVHAAPMVEA